MAQAEKSRDHLSLVPKPDFYCVALTGPTFLHHEKPKSYRFRWNPTTRTWNRLLPELGSAKTLARQMRDLGFTVSLHVARNDEMKPTRKPFVVIAEKKTPSFTILPTKRAVGYSSASISRPRNSYKSRVAEAKLDRSIAKEMSDAARKPHNSKQASKRRSDAFQKRQRRREKHLSS